MEFRGTLACFILLTTIPSTVISANCNTTLCSNVMNLTAMAQCCLNFTYNTASTSLKSTTVPTTTVQIYVYGNSNGSRTCLNSSDCNGEGCLSFKCSISRNVSGKSTEQCLCDGCNDGRCFNTTLFDSTTSFPPTTMAPGGGITTLQLVLLFGSMGGIIVIICIIYCVKTFEDNRQRQYLLKHGVWDPPRDQENKGKDDTEETGSHKSQGSIYSSKMEVPTIHVQMENEISKSKESGLQPANEDDDIDDSTEEKVKPKAIPKIQTDIIQVKGYAPIPAMAPSENAEHENANRTAPTKDLNREKTIPQETIESTIDNNISSSWNKDSSKVPLHGSPIRNRNFPALKKNKDPPKKIIANGTPEKSPKLTHKNRTVTPPQLVEPENFSDFGM